MPSVPALLFALAGLSLVKGQPGNILKLTSHLDGNVITSTDYLEDPGPYNVYGTKAEPYAFLPTQQWEYHQYSDGTRHFGALGGQFLNTFSSYKPCPSCFVANEVWRILPLENDAVMLQSTWTDLCLTNPGEDYLKKEPCDTENHGQHWVMEMVG